MELLIRYKGEEHTLLVQDGDIILFPEGLVGFTDWRRFVLLEDPEEAPVAVLQCIDDTDISFLVTDPNCVAPGFTLELSAEDRSELGLAAPGSERALCILAIKRGPVAVTANLLAPIVINSETRVARQVIMEGSEYSVQHPVLVAGRKNGHRRKKRFAAG